MRAQTQQKPREDNALTKPSGSFGLAMLHLVDDVPVGHLVHVPVHDQVVVVHVLLPVRVNEFFVQDATLHVLNRPFLRHVPISRLALGLCHVLPVLPRVCVVHHQVHGAVEKGAKPRPILLEKERLAQTAVVAGGLLHNVEIHRLLHFVHARLQHVQFVGKRGQVEHAHRFVSPLARQYRRVLGAVHHQRLRPAIHNASPAPISCVPWH